MQNLLKIIDWEIAQFGDYLHTTTLQTEKILKKYFQLKTKLPENPTLNDIAAIISKGHPIIVPCAGKLLENPYFTNGGPKYHMLVVKGYDLIRQNIITHDVGTRRGADFIYPWSRFQNANHDWHDSDIQNGKKIIIEVYL